MTRLAGDAARHAGGALLVKMVRVVQELAVAAVLGLHSSLDGWLALYALSFLPINILLHAVQPPIVAAWAGRSAPRPTERAFYPPAALFGGIAGAFIVLAIGPAWLETLSAAAAVTESLHRLVPLLAVATFFGALSIAWNGFLQASGRFLLAGALPALVPVAMIVSLLLADERGIEALAWGLAAGALAEAVASLVLLARCSRSGCAERHDRRVSGAPSDEVLGASVMLLPGVLLAVLVPLVEQYFAARLGGAGGIAALGYAQRVPYFFSGLLTMAVAAAGTAHLATTPMTTRGRERSALFTRAAGWVAGLGVGLAAAVAFTSRPLVEALFVRGAFGDAEAAVVAPVMAVLALGLPFQLVRVLALRSLVVDGRALAASGVHFASFVALLAANLLVAASASGVAGHEAARNLAAPSSGLVGVAASTTFAAAAGAVLGVVLARKRRGTPNRGAGPVKPGC